MDESTRHWFDKLETSFNDFKATYIEKSTEVSTKLDAVLENHSAYDTRLDALEQWKFTKDGEDSERDRSSDRRFKRWGIIIVSAEVVVAVVVAVVVKAVWG